MFTDRLLHSWKISQNLSLEISQSSSSLIPNMLMFTGMGKFNSGDHYTTVGKNPLEEMR